MIMSVQFIAQYNVLHAISQVSSIRKPGPPDNQHQRVRAGSDGAPVSPRSTSRRSLCDLPFSRREVYRGGGPF